MSERNRGDQPSRSTRRVVRSLISSTGVGYCEPETRRHCPVPSTLLRRSHRPPSTVSEKEDVPATEKIDQNIVTRGVDMLQNRLACHSGGYFNPYVLEMLAHVDTGDSLAVDDPDTMDQLYLDAEEKYELVRVIVSPEQIVFATSNTPNSTLYRPTVNLIAPDIGPESEPMFSKTASLNIAGMEAEFNA